MIGEYFESIIARKSTNKNQNSGLSRVGWPKIYCKLSFLKDIVYKDNQKIFVNRYIW